MNTPSSTPPDDSESPEPTAPIAGQAKRPTHPDDSESPEGKGSALNQLERLLKGRGELTGNIARIPYIDRPRSAAYTIRLTPQRNLSIEIRISGPYGTETEKHEINLKTGETSKYSTREPEYFQNRILAVVYCAIGLPSHYWESSVED